MSVALESSFSERSYRDREEIDNIWDHNVSIKRSISNPVQNILKEGMLLIKEDEALKKKLGIQLIRFCLKDNPELANQWVYDLSPSLLKDPHPRVRHSTLWNIRTALWQDPRLARTGLSFAKMYLKDDDPAVQRVSIWLHGDSVLNDPSLYDDSSHSINDFLEESDKESNRIFALEEFFVPLKSRYSATNEYRSSVERLMSKSDGYPGVKARCSQILDTRFGINSSDISSTEARFDSRLKPGIIKSLVEKKRYQEVSKVILDDLLKTDHFSVKMKNIWLLRDLVWIDPEISTSVFNSLVPIILENRDGDLTRTTTVLMGDCFFLNPDQLHKDGFRTIYAFFCSNQNDGSQIVVSQMLHQFPKDNLPTQIGIKRMLPFLNYFAVNQSVRQSLSIHW